MWMRGGGYGTCRRNILSHTVRLCVLRHKDHQYLRSETAVYLSTCFHPQKALITHISHAVPGSSRAWIISCLDHLVPGSSRAWIASIPNPIPNSIPQRAPGCLDPLPLLVLHALQHGQRLLILSLLVASGTLLEPLLHPKRLEVLLGAGLVSVLRVRLAVGHALVHASADAGGAPGVVVC
jgi:hypothetical protein